ncbi:hypothetical protein JCM10450v2_000388 [Rhodotorula kratochvilovae]
MYASAGSSWQGAQREPNDTAPPPPLPSDPSQPTHSHDPQLHAAHYAYYADGSPSYGHAQHYAATYAPPPPNFHHSPETAHGYCYTQSPASGYQAERVAPPLSCAYPSAPYNHDRTFAAVESARWTGAMDSLAEAGQPSSVPAAAASTSAAVGLIGEDVRRWSIASSGESGDTGDNPLIGTMALFEDDLAGPPPEIKPFVQKLWDMLSDPQHYQDVILWNHAGDSFFVAHNDRFITEVLPSAFGHSNVHSFTRQLNVYNFQRMNVAQLRAALDLQGGIAGAYSGWTHAQFRRGDASTLASLVPRPSRARLIRKLEKQYGGSSNTSSSNSSSTTSSAASSGPRSPRSASSARLANPPSLHQPQPRPPPTYYSQLAPDGSNYP